MNDFYFYENERLKMMHDTNINRMFLIALPFAILAFLGFDKCSQMTAQPVTLNRVTVSQGGMMSQKKVDGYTADNRHLTASLMYGKSPELRTSTDGSKTTTIYKSAMGVYYVNQ